MSDPKDITRFFSVLLCSNSPDTEETHPQQQSTRVTAAVTESDSSAPAHSRPGQGAEGMAMEPEDRCPICLDNFIEKSYLMPCAHKFCFACILQWAESKPECPLCKRAAHSIVRMVLVNDGLNNICSALTVSSVVDPQDYPSLLRSIPPWMYWKLQVLFENESSLTAIMQNIIIPFLAIFSLDEELLVQLLGPSFRSCIVAFERQFMEVPVQWNRREAFSLRQDNSPRGASLMAVPDPSHSPEGTSAEDVPGISAAALGGDSTSPPSASTLVLGVQEEIQEEPEEAVDTSREGREFPSGGPQQTLMRGPISPEASSPGVGHVKVRPSRQQH